MKKLYTSHTYICWSISGLLLAGAFLHPYVWPLSIPALWIFFELFSRTDSLKNIFFGTWIVGSIKAAGGIVWLWYVYPLSDMGIGAGIGQVFLIGLYWATTSIFIGIGFALVFTFFKKIEKKWLSFIILFPIIWIFADLLGSFVFSVYSLGPGSTPNINFSFGYIGYLLSDIPVLFPIAIFGGVYALSFFAVLFIFVVFLVYKKTTKMPTVFLIGMTLSALVVIYIFNPIPKVSQEGVRIIAIDTQFNSELFTSLRGFVQKEYAVTESVKAALQYEVDYILLPEDSRFTTSFISTQVALNFVLANSQGREVVLVDSARIVDKRGETVLRAFIYDTKTETVSIIDKQYLVPQGEFIPYLPDFFISIFTDDEFYKKIGEGYSYRPGLEISYETIPENVPPILFCFESVSPTGVRDALSARTAPFVLHQISHAWFHTPTNLWFNLSRMLRTQALWNGVDVIEAGNMKKSISYKPDGSITEGISLEGGDMWQLIQYEL